MPLPFVPIGIGLLGASVFVAKKRREEPISPEIKAERRVIYEAALNSKMSSDKLRRLAKAFHEVGQIAECKMLILRAQLREAPPEVQTQRKAAYRKGMESKNPEAIRNLADAFDMIGAAGAATSLRKYAQGVEDAVKLDSVNTGQAPMDPEEFNGQSSG
jgi:hypothetical protein